MSYTVTPESTKSLNLFPVTVLEEILQNVAVIISTPKFTVPMHRDFGLTMDFIDKPQPTAEAMLIAEVYEQVDEYEPRAEIVSITVDKDAGTGKMTPRVEVNPIEDE